MSLFRLLTVIVATTSIASGASLQVLDGFDVQGISADGSTLVGKVRETWRPSIWTNSQGMIALPYLPGGEYGLASAVSSDGSVVVGWNHSGTAWRKAFLWQSSGAMLDLGDIFLNTVVDISGGGTVVVGGNGTAFRWTSTTGRSYLGSLGGVTGGSTANAISTDGRAVVGIADSPIGTQPFRWTETTGMVGLGLPAGWSQCLWMGANDVSGDGSVVVGAVQRPLAYGAETKAFVWTADQGMTLLPSLHLGGGPVVVDTVANAVSADGCVIVGEASGVGMSTSSPFIWDRTNGIRFLKDVLTESGLDLSDWDLRTAVAISADGTKITGAGLHEGTGWSYVAVIPEPATLSLLALGGLAVMARRKRPEVTSSRAGTFGGRLSPGRPLRLGPSV